MSNERQIVTTWADSGPSFECTCRCGRTVSGTGYGLLVAVLHVGWVTLDDKEAFCSIECAVHHEPEIAQQLIDRLDEEIGVRAETVDAIQNSLGKATEGKMCEVCGKEPATTMRCSALGAVSFAYGDSCAEEGAEPYNALLGTLARCNGRKNAADWMLPIIDATLAVVDITVENLDRDVEQLIQTQDNGTTKHHEETCPVTT